MDPTAHRAGMLGLLHERLRRLEALGLVRPPTYSILQYLQSLANEGVLSEEAAHGVADLYHRCRFGRMGLLSDEQTAAAAVLDAAIARLESADEPRTTVVNRWRQRMTHATLPHGPLERTPPRKSGSMPTSGTKKQATVVASPSAKMRKRLVERGPSRFWIFVACGLVVWTVLVAAGSLWQRDRILEALSEMEWARTLTSASQRSTQVDPRDNLPPGHLRRNPAALARVGQRYAELDDFAEAIHAYQRAIAVSETDLESESLACNNLAWLLLTAEDGWYRDPSQAKELALRSVALNNTKPEYLDTLAEAYFQTGEVAAAVETERKALELVRQEPGHDPTHYVKQLRRFEDALEAEPPTTAVNGS